MTFGPITVNRPGASATVGIMGPIGKTGAPGTNGTVGQQGPAVFTPIAAWQSGETYAPGTATQAASYVSVGGSSYACTTLHTSGVFTIDLADGLWEPVALQGSQGVPGTPGSTWYSGLGAPSPSIGINGDYFLRTDTYDVLLKVSGAWSKIGNLQGSPGNTIRTGTGAPSASVGVNGDSYIDITPGAPVFWGPKANGAWPSSGTSMVGPSGPGNGSVNPSGAATPGNVAVFGPSNTVIKDGGTLGGAAFLNTGIVVGTVATGDAVAARLVIANALSEIATAALQGSAATNLAVLQIATALAEIAAQGHLAKVSARNNLGVLSKGRTLALALLN